SYQKALALGLWSGLVVAFADNALRPWIVGEVEKQNPVLIGFGMLGGTFAMGPLGLVFGPLLISLTGAVVEEIQSIDSNVKAVSPDAVGNEAEGTPEPEAGSVTILAGQVRE